MTEQPPTPEETPAAPDEAAPTNTPTEGGEATTTPEGAEGWVDPAGLPSPDEAVTADVAPEASPEASEQSSRDEQEGGGDEASTVPPELDSEGEAIPESHTAYHGAPEGYELPARLPEALEAERLAAQPEPEPEPEPEP